MNTPTQRARRRSDSHSRRRRRAVDRRRGRDRAPLRGLRRRGGDERPRCDRRGRRASSPISSSSTGCCPTSKASRSAAACAIAASRRRSSSSPRRTRSRTRSRRCAPAATTTSRSRSASPSSSRACRRSCGARRAICPATSCASPTSCSTRAATRSRAADVLARPHRDRVQPAAVLHAQPASRPLEGADPPERVALRLRRQHERRRDVRQLPPPQARRRRAADDPDGPAGGLHARIRSALDAQEPLAARALDPRRDRARRGRARGRGLRDVHRAPLVPHRPDGHVARRGAPRGRGRAVPSRRPGDGGGGDHGAPPQDAPPFDGPGIGRLTAAAPGEYVELRRLDGTIVRSGSTPRFPGSAPAPAPRLPAKITLPAGTGERVVYFTVPAKSGGDRYRVRASIEPQANDYVVVVASSLSDVDSTLHRLLLIALARHGARPRRHRAARALGRASRAAPARARSSRRRRRSPPATSRSAWRARTTRRRSAGSASR